MPSSSTATAVAASCTGSCGSTVFDCRLTRGASLLRAVRWSDASFGIRPRGKNPNFCRACFETVPVGGHERAVGVLFVDLRGFTVWSRNNHPSRSPPRPGLLPDRCHALMAHDAIIDKFVGDEVMALFLADMPTLGDHTCDEMLKPRASSSRGHRKGPDSLGWASDSTTGPRGSATSGRRDEGLHRARRRRKRRVAAPGLCEPGQIVISAEVRDRLHELVVAAPTSFTVKGKNDPLDAHIVTTTTL